MRKLLAAAAFAVFAHPTTAGAQAMRTPESKGYGAPLAEMAKGHPHLVDKLIVISTAFRSDGYYPEVLKAFAQMPAAAPMLAADVSKSPLASLSPSVNWETRT